MTQSYTILVLLPVFNGARYLSEQIDLILAQQWNRQKASGDIVNILLLCRDDASTDNSLALLRDYATRYPDNIRLVQDSAGNLGAAGNFSALMRVAESEAVSHPGSQPYIALADQDDIWHVNKLQRSLTAMLAAENGDTERPVLVHSDLQVVDAAGKPIAASFMSYQGLRPARASLTAQLVSNTLTGCTAMLNLALIRKALPVPGAAVMHDWWLSLVASAFGSRVYLDEPLVDYRQHDSNTIGARSHTPAALSLDMVRELLKTHQSPEQQQAFEDIAAQAVAFVQRHGDEISVAQRFVCRRIIALPDVGLWQQRLLFRALHLL